MKDLHEELNALGAAFAVKALAKAARKAFQPVLEAAVAAAPVDTGLTRDNIKIRVSKPKEGDAVAVVGLRVARPAFAKGMTKAERGAVKDRDPSWRWHFIELGTKFQPARPFLRPALDANAQVVIDGLKVELRKEIDRVVKRRAKALAKAKAAAGDS